MPEILRIGDFSKIQRRSINPNIFSKEEFYHFSIPAFDETGSAAREVGAAIESGKFLITERCILLSKLNPRKPRILAVNPETARPSRHLFN